MIYPTIVQNGALYLIQHKVSKGRRAADGRRPKAIELGSLVPNALKVTTSPWIGHISGCRVPN